MHEKKIGESFHILYYPQYYDVLGQSRDGHDHHSHRTSASNKTVVTQ